MSWRAGRIIGLAVVLVVGWVTAGLGPAVAGAASHQGGGGGTGTSVSVLFGGGPDVKEVAEYTIRLTVRGEVSINFHGDRQTGCQRRGLCAYSGQLALRPPPQGALFLTKFRRHRQIFYDAALDLFSGSSEAQFASHTTRLVPGFPPALCADEASNPIFPTATSRHGRLTLRLIQAGGGAVSTRCAGPVDGDVFRAAPRATFSIRSLMRAGERISLAGTHRFAGHGFAGTVSSTLTLRLGKIHRQVIPTAPKGKTKRIRVVTERLRLVRTSGGLTLAIRGSSNHQVCSLLDSCGLAGSLSWTPVPAKAGAVLTATGLATRPRRDFLAALGLFRHGNPKGISLGGQIHWKDHGLFSERVTQAGTCADRVGLMSGFVSLYQQNDGIEAFYVPGATLRTRCPGPLLESGVSSLASQTLSARRVSRRRLTIDLRPPSAIQNDGYVGRPSGHISLVLQRSGHTTQRVMTVPAGLVGLFTH